jgi:hypothetical protein
LFLALTVSADGLRFRAMNNVLSGAALLGVGDGNLVSPHSKPFQERAKWWVKSGFVDGPN